MREFKLSELTDAQKEHVNIVYRETTLKEDFMQNECRGSTRGYRERPLSEWVQFAHPTWRFIVLNMPDGYDPNRMSTYSQVFDKVRHASMNSFVSSVYRDAMSGEEIEFDGFDDVLQEAKKFAIANHQEEFSDAVKVGNYLTEMYSIFIRNPIRVFADEYIDYGLQPPDDNGIPYDLRGSGWQCRNLHPDNPMFREGWVCLFITETVQPIGQLCHLYESGRGSLNRAFGSAINAVGTFLSKSNLSRNSPPFDGECQWTFGTEFDPSTGRRYVYAKEDNLFMSSEQLRAECSASDGSNNTGNRISANRKFVLDLIEREGYSFSPDDFGGIFAYVDVRDDQLRFVVENGYYYFDGTPYHAGIESSDLANLSFEGSGGVVCICDRRYEGTLIEVE